MTIIVWLRRSGSTDIGEQRVYSNAQGIEEITLDKDIKYRIKYMLGISIPREDTRIKEQIIKMEIIP